MTVTHSSLTWAHTVAMMSLDISLLNPPPPRFPDLCVWLLT